MAKLNLRITRLFAVRARAIGIDNRCLMACLLSTLLTSTVLPRKTSAQSQREFDQLVSSSGYIFSGTVLRQSDQAGSSGRRGQGTVSIRVDHVIEVPTNIRLKPGNQVWLLPTRGEIAAGESAVFFAQTLELGNDIFLKEVARMSVSEAPKLARRVADAHARITEQALLARIESSSLVIVGEVVNVRGPEGVPQVFTEHNPEWHDATVSIHDVLKGDSALKSVVIRFAASLDIAWASAPKFRNGQTAIWLLHGLPAKAKIQLPEHVFIVLDPLDVQPTSELDRVRALVGRK